MSATQMGWEGTIHISASTDGEISGTTTGMTELVNCRNLKMNINYSELEHTLKKHRGMKSYLKGMLEFSVTFDVSKEYTTSGGSRTYEADVAIILAALKSRKPIRAVILDGNGEGIAGDFLVNGSEMSLDGDEAQVVSCTLKPAAGSDPVEFVD